MAIQNKTRYAILGILFMKPCSGYDIKKFCDKTISHYWNENFGHIYPVLKQLSEEGLIALDIQAEDNRRKIYSITEAGREAFYQWLEEPPQIQPARSELLLKLSFGNHMPRHKVIAMLEEVKIRNTRNLEQYRMMESSYVSDETIKKDPAYPFWLSSLRLGIMNSETVIRWSRETIELLEEYSSSKE